MTNENEAPERIWAVSGYGCWQDEPPASGLRTGRWTEYTRKDISDARIAELEAQNRELALQIISSDGQEMDAYDAQMKAEQRAEAAEAKLAKAVDEHKEYAVGPLTIKQVFEAAGLTDMHDMQAVLDRVEIALTAAPDLPATDAQIKANPKVQALVEAANELIAYCETGAWPSRDPVQKTQSALEALEADHRMTIDIEQLRKDMEAGTQGDWEWVSDSHLKNVFRVDEYAGVGWLEWTEEISETFSQYDDGVFVSKGANARRIARLPELEREYLALREAKAAEKPTIDPDAKDARIAELEAERDEQVQWVKDLADDVISLEAKLAKAVKMMELSVELATWNTTLLDDVILFITELKESKA